MSCTSAVMKDITHYFRPSSKNDEQCADCSISNTNIEAKEELKNDDCKLYLSDSDDERDFVTPKKKPHLIVQVPGVSVSKDSARKRKCKDDLPPRLKKIKAFECDSPISRHREFNSENVKMEESYYMSPLRLDSDSSPEGSPTPKNTSVSRLSNTSPVFHKSGKRKGSLRIAKNPFLNPSKSKTESPDISVAVIKSPLSQRTPVRGKNESSREKEGSGSLHKYFENVSAVKSRSLSTSPDIECISSPDKRPDAVIISPDSDSVKSTAKLKSVTTQLRESPRKRTIAAVDSPVVISQKVKSVAKSPARDSVGHEQEAGTSSASKCKASPRTAAEGFKNSTNNNILNYFEKARIPKRPKRRKLKSRKINNEEKRGPKVPAVKKSDAGHIVEEKVKSEVAFAAKRSNARRSVSNTKRDVRDFTESLDNRTTMTRQRSRSQQALNRFPLNDSLAPSFDQLNNYSRSSRSLRNDDNEKSESFVTGAVRTSRRSRSCQRSWSMHPELTVAPSTSQKSQERTATTMGKSNGRKLKKLRQRKPSHPAKSPEVVKKVAAGNSPKNSSTSDEKSPSPVHAKQKSANQCRAAAIVKRACRQPQLKQQIQRKSDPSIPGASSSDEVIILSEKASNGATKEIVIRPSFVKLAPLFLAKEELQRKKFFLQSGAPDVVLRRMKQQKKMEEELEEASDFPLVSHTQQKEATFPWCLETNPKLLQYLWRSNNTDRLVEQEEMLNVLCQQLCLGSITSLPTFLAAMLIHLRPPLPNLATPDGTPTKSPEDLDSPNCFCEAMSPNISVDERSHVYSHLDVEMFERVHAWLMRSLLPPGVAYKMCVDLSFFLPSSSSAGYENNHIFVVPRDSSAPSLRKDMLLQLKEDYPSFPVHRKYKDFYLRKRSDGGLYAYTMPPTHEVITLDASPPSGRNDRSGDKEGSSNSKNSITPNKLRRSVRRVSVSHSTPMPAAVVKDTTEQNSDSGTNSHLSINDTAVKAPCSSLLTSECWTDIFAPASFMDACSLGRNLKTLDKLWNWLDSWAKNSNSRGNKKDKKSSNCSDSEEENSSGDEFCTPGEESVKRDNRNLPTNVAILIGPCGSGKTSSVYALAKELNYKVLEINASSKRSGKYILATVKEATRSHQVMSSGGRNSPASIGSFFKKNTPNKSSASAQKKTPKASPKPSEKASSAMSLIFVEDVDVIFENEDEGFIGALTSLTTSTKRPVILEVHSSKPLRMGTTNNWLLEETLTESCPHLINFLARQNRTPLILPFERYRNKSNAEALLRVACLAEGIWVSKEWSECMIKQTAGDIRRALQEAQFWAGSVARSSIMLDNVSRYPKELTQKSDMEDKSEVALLAQKLAPVNLCGCVGKRACTYPYSWMHNDYIQHIWLNLDRIVDTAVMIMQDVVTSGVSGDDKAFCLSPSGQRSLKSAAKEEILKQEPSDASPRNELSSKSQLIKKNLLSSFMGAVKTEKPDQVISPPRVRQSSRPNKGNRRIDLTVGRRRSSSKMNSPSDVAYVRCMNEPKVKKKEEGVIKEEKVTDDASEKLNSVLSKKGSSQEVGNKMELLAFSDYLDVLCMSDVLLKKFKTAGSPEVGKNLVFEIGSVSRLISLATQVSSSEKSREMEAKQVKDSCTASQYQMILPIMPNHWILNCPALALDVAPHIRETCRALEELTQTGKTRTRLSHRLPTINRVGPTLREALCSTLVDDVSVKAPPDGEKDPWKEEGKSQK